MAQVGAAAVERAGEAAGGIGAAPPEAGQRQPPHPGEAQRPGDGHRLRGHDVVSLSGHRRGSLGQGAERALHRRRQVRQGEELQRRVATGQRAAPAAGEQRAHPVAAAGRGRQRHRRGAQQQPRHGTTGQAAAQPRLELPPAPRHRVLGGPRSGKPFVHQAGVAMARLVDLAAGDDHQRSGTRRRCGDRLGLGRRRRRTARQVDHRRAVGRARRRRIAHAGPHRDALAGGTGQLAGQEVGEPAIRRQRSSGDDEGARRHGPPRASGSRSTVRDSGLAIRGWRFGAPGCPPILSHLATLATGTARVGPK